MEHGMKGLKQCLGALFSFGSIAKQQISPGLQQVISVPAQQDNLGLHFPGAVRGILRVCPAQVEASLLPSLCWLGGGTGNALI